MTRRFPSVLWALLLVAGCGGSGTPPAGPGVAGNGGGGGGGGSGGARGSVSPREDQVLLVPTDPGLLTTLLLEKGSTLRGPVLGTAWFVVTVPAGGTAAGFVSDLEADARVLAASLDLRLRGPEGDGSTAPIGGLMLSSQLPDQSELLRIGAAEARSRTRGAGVRVAVLDSGVLFDHESVAGRTEPDGYDFVGDDPDPTEQTNGIDEDADGASDEDHGHGTFVSSLVLAVAPDARVVPVRVLDADGVGTSSAVASAITYAATHGCHVVNLSVAVPAEVQVVREAIENARLLGVQVVASAGNTGAEDVLVPSAALLVTAVGPDDRRPDFASYGSAVDLCAPGVEIHGGYPASPGTARWSGTSFAAALVTGACALLRAQNPTWSVEEVALRIAESATPVDPLNAGYEGRLGAGRLDLDAATTP